MTTSLLVCVMCIELISVVVFCVICTDLLVMFLCDAHRTISDGLYVMHADVSDSLCVMCTELSEMVYV